MALKFNIKRALILISFVGMSHGGQATTFQENHEKKLKREESDESFCCLDKRHENPVKGHEVKFQRFGKNGGKYRIPLMRANKNLKPLDRDGETEEGEGTGFRKDSRSNLRDTESHKTGNETKLINKRQKIIFRKNIAGRKDPDKKKVIYLLGLFDLTQPRRDLSSSVMQSRFEERSEGKSEIWAAKLAVKHVNQLQLNGGYQLRLYMNDTKCDPGVAVDALFHALFVRSTPLSILLGSVCSMATASLASITPYWNIVQISFGATSPVLSNRKKYPMFYRVAAPDSSHNLAKLAFIRHFGWNTVTFLSQNEKEYILTVNYFIKLLEKENVTCKGTVTFGKNDFQDQLNYLKEMDTRIIFGSFSDEIAPRIFCKVYELGVYGSNYAWILQGGLKRNWWKNDTECSEKKLRMALQGVFFVTSYHDPDLPHSFHQNFTSKDLRRELRKRGIPESPYVHESYDAIWTAAIALNESLKSWKEAKEGTEIEDFNYDRSDMAETIFNKVSHINLIGMSGPILFDGADRLGMSAIYQLQGDDIPIVAVYFPDGKCLNFTCNSCRKIIWEGGQVPVSQRFLLRRIETIAFEAFLTVACSTSVAIILAVLFLVFNSYFRKLKNMKLSSPKLNNIAVAGCIAVYIGVFLLGLDFATLPNTDYYSIVCTAKIFFFSAGFSLAFGSSFAKTYRVHKIFIKSQGGFMKKKFLQDRQLILLVGVLLLIDGLILTIWVTIDPLQRQLHNATLEYSTVNRSVMYQTQIEICSCKHMNGWLSFLYMYKGLQLLMGVFLAWETRHVKIPGLNDSQYIVLSVYSVVITSCIVIVLANLIFEKPTIAYVIISIMILSSTTATLCSLFFPKVKIIFSKSMDNFDPIMSSVGLTLESNTRRFVMDDAKEKLYRLEVQNRVFKREAFSLGNEISRLEKELNSGFSAPIVNSWHGSQLSKLTSDIRHQSLLEISRFSDYPKLPIRFLARSWPGDIHKIMTPISQSQSFQWEPKVDGSKKTPILKPTSGKEKMKNFLKSTINPTKKKDSSDGYKNSIGKTRKNQKFVLSQYLPYVQKTIQDVKSNEELRDFNVWRLDNEEGWRIRRKSQPSSKIRFKGSPRFPHRIVPGNFFLAEIDNQSKPLDEFTCSGRNVIIHQVEISASSVLDDKINN